MIAEPVVVNIAGGLDVRLPRMVRVRQRFETTRLADVAATVTGEFSRPEIRSKISPGMKIAVGVGSRGIANIAECTRQVIAELGALGAAPFIVPAMGSHGAATGAGQREVLAGYGITEERMGCPILAQMEVVELGRVDGSPIYMDRLAAAADGIVVVCRVKPHTSFRAPIESGIVKMLTIGLGKITGAAELHTHGMDRFGDLLPRAAQLIMERRNFLLGLAMVENAADETAWIEAVPAERLLDREPELQAMAKSLMARLYFDEIDVLIVDRIGKNISGAGMDPNITGRNPRSVKWSATPSIKQIVVLGLTPETRGNASGVGLADIITMRVYREMDIGATYANVITAVNLMDAAAIPIIMNSDRDAIRLAAKSVLRTRPEDTRIVRIANTLAVVEIQVSEPMLGEISGRPDRFEIVGPAEPFGFTDGGSLTPL
jgi:hypothetical protein